MGKAKKCRECGEDVDGETVRTPACWTWRSGRMVYAPGCRRTMNQLVERAAERKASAPVYPDPPEQIAEQEAVTRAVTRRRPPSTG